MSQRTIDFSIEKLTVNQLYNAQNTHKEISEKFLAD